MVNRTCDQPECDRPHLARGMCASHYTTWHRTLNGRGRRSEYFDRRCIVCGTTYRSARRDGKFCSDQCKSVDYRSRKWVRGGRPATSCALPADHPVMTTLARLQGQRQAEAERRRLERQREQEAWPKPWMTERQCPECDARFTPLRTSTTVYCTKRCIRRASKRKRRARENHTTNMWTWSEFNKIVLKFDHCCAYCGEQPDGQIEADYVVPLSRGGQDALSNLLPACHTCNANKSAHSLESWAVWREAKGLPPRQVTWLTSDARYTHLSAVPHTPALLAAS